MDTSGFIYSLYNSSFKSYGENVYKLGKCKNLKNRLSGYVTGYLEKPEYVLTSKLLSDRNLAESMLFSYLKKYRIYSNREFFKCDIEIIKQAFEKIEKYFEEKNNKTIIINNHSKIDYNQLFNNLLDEENLKSYFNFNHEDTHNSILSKKWKVVRDNDLIEAVSLSFFEEMNESLSDDTMIQFKQFFHEAKLKLSENNKNNPICILQNNEEDELDL